METLRLKIDRITFLKQETGYVVLKGLARKRKVTAVGILPDVITNTNLVGAEYEFRGNWETSKYGHQFSFKYARLLTNQLFYFLAKIVKGLGEKLSRDLINHYGETQLLQILEHEPEKLTEFKGIKEKKLAKIKASWEKQKNLRELSQYLLPHGITPNLLIRIHNHFGNEAIKKTKENPHCLTEIRGIGFKTADEIAIKVGVDFDSSFRIQSAINHILLEAAEDEGHTYLPMKTLHEKLKELLDTDEKKISPEGIKEAIDILTAQGKLYLSEAKGEGSEARDNLPLASCLSPFASSKVALTAYKHMEDSLFWFFKERSNSKLPPISRPDRVEKFIAKEEKKIGFRFSGEQKRIIRQVATGRNRVYALSGYAGTGKSTISRAILEFLEENFCQRHEIVCCAFTGMASLRIRRLTGYPSYTIHTLLKYKGENEFEYGSKNKLPYQVILLDEASMVNLQLFYRLTQAIERETLFIMVGDPAQLPPIGAGNVFGDIIRKDFLSRTTLNTIFRQNKKSALVYFANIIRTGKVPPEYKKGYKDFAFSPQDIPDYFRLRKELPEAEIRQVRDENNEKIRQRILGLASQATDRLKHPVWDFRLLSPMRKGILGTETMNVALQEIFNRNGRNSVSRFGITLKEGDKVVHLKNQDMDSVEYSPKILKEERINYKRQRIFNGNVGVVRKIDQENEEFFVLYPDRILVRYDFDHIKDLIDLAYCLTVHKAQGSQYKYVAIPISNSHFIMLNSRWFYTAITRAEKKVFLVGQEYAFRRACTNIDTAERMTFLKG